MEAIEKVESVMDRSKVANTIHAILDSAVEMLQKGKLYKEDFDKMKLIRTTYPVINTGLGMIQQETAQQKILLVQQKFAELGYERKPELPA